MRSVTGSLASSGGGSQQWAERSARPEVRVSSDSVAQTLPMLLTPTGDVEEQSLLLPRPEELPPLADGNDTRNAILWLGVLLVCLILIVVASGP